VEGTLVIGADGQPIAVEVSTDPVSPGASDSEVDADAVEPVEGDLESLAAPAPPATAHKVRAPREGHSEPTGPIGTTLNLFGEEEA